LRLSRSINASFLQPGVILNTFTKSSKLPEPLRIQILPSPPEQIVD
jgi:hypothetical protein